MWNSFVAVLRKELLHILRDRAMLAMAFSIPVFQLVLFGFIDQTVHDLPTVVVDQDRSPESRLLMDELRASGTFAVTHLTSSPRSARQDIVSGRARAAVIIPPDFHDKRTRGTTAQILVLIDGSDSTASAQALASVNGLIAQKNIQLVADRISTLSGGSAGSLGGLPLAVQPIILFNPDGRYANYIIPGLVAILLQIVALVLTSIAIVREREQGTLEQLLVTPVHPLGLMLGKLAPYLFVGLGEMALILFLMRFGFSVPIHGNLVFLFGMAVVYLFSLMALGLFISTRAQTQAQAQQMAQMFLLPSIFLSGYIFPFEGLPHLLQLVGLILPATHMVAIMRGVVLRDAGPIELLPHVLAMVVISALLVWMSVRNFKKVSL